MKIFVLTAFILTFVLIIAVPRFKTVTTAIIAVITANVCLIGGSTDLESIALSVDLNVFLLLIGIMVTVYCFSESNMPNKIAEGIMSKMKNSITALVLLTVLSGVISAFVDNVATVLMLAPIGIAIAKKIGVSPIPVLIAISVSSNLQGAATLVGDTTSVMLGSYAKMNFLEFIFLNGKPSIFFAVEIGAVLTIPVLIFIFRKDNKKLIFTPMNVKITSIVPTVLISLNLLVLIAFSFIPYKLVAFGQDITNGVICMVFGVISFIYCVAKERWKITKLKDAVDYSTVLFLLSLFILVGLIEEVGIIKDISNAFVGLGNNSVLLLYTVIVFGSVIISAFIDNIPYVATMLPVISLLCEGLPNVSPYLLYFGLLCGATLGGNITPVGASANVVAIGLLNKEGYKVRNRDFFKIGIPFTLIAVLAGYVFCWLVWGM